MEKNPANIKYTCSWMKHMIPRIYINVLISNRSCLITYAMYANLLTSCRHTFIITVINKLNFAIPNTIPQMQYRYNIKSQVLASTNRNHSAYIPYTVHAQNISEFLKVYDAKVSVSGNHWHRLDICRPCPCCSPITSKQTIL